jgi:hypothetical protein
LGGHNGIFTAVFDSRISVIITSCGFDSFADYYGGNEEVWMPEKGWCQTRYMPKLANYRGRLEEVPFDFSELLGAIAPRRIMVIATLHDSNFAAASVHRVVASAKAVYTLYDKPQHLTLMHPDCKHDFPVDMRQAAYSLFEKEFKNARPALGKVETLPN